MHLSVECQPAIVDAAAGINIEALTERNKQPQQVAVEDDDDDDDGAGVGLGRRGRQ